VGIPLLLLLLLLLLDQGLGAVGAK